MRCEVQGERCGCPRAVRSRDWWVSVPPTQLQVALLACVPSLRLISMLTSAGSVRLEGGKKDVKSTTSYQKSRQREL